MQPTYRLLGAFGAVLLASTLNAAPWVTYEPKSDAGGGAGKHIVLLSGDEEYRSEEGLPQLAKILSQRHGFKCTVLFSQDPDGTINPNNSSNIPGMEALDRADLVVNQFRFRELPDADMAHFDQYVQSGKPMIVLRTATHSFNYTKNKSSVYAKYDWQHQGGVWTGGFGGATVGETWTYHHGDHGKEGTRGIIDGKNRRHPILKEVRDVFGPTDVYGVNADFPNDATVLLYGQVLKSLDPASPPNLDKAVMPLVWLRDYRGDSGKTSKVLCSTIGAATDFKCEDLRRLFVNACYSLTGTDVPAKADVAYVGDFDPTFFGFNKFKSGVKVSAHELK
jgi:hypothetical protein